MTAPALAKRGSEALALPPSSSLCVASHSLVHSLLWKRVEGTRIHSVADTVHTRSVALRVHPVLAVVVSVHVCFGWFTTEGLVFSCTPSKDGACSLCGCVQDPPGTFLLTCCILSYFGSCVPDRV